MNEGQGFSELVRNEVFGMDQGVRDRFLKKYAKEIEEFIECSSLALERWSEYEKSVGQNEQKEWINIFLYNSINNLVISLKLLINGYIVPPGNLLRSSIESFSTAILCSNSSLGYLNEIRERKFSFNKSINILLKHLEKFSLKREALNEIKNIVESYNKFSHATYFSLGQVVNFSNDDQLIFGAYFDDAKIEYYKKEIKQRIRFMKVVQNILENIDSVTR